MDEIRTTKLLIGNKLLELVDEEGRELIGGLSSRVDNLLDEYGTNMGTVRTAVTLFESSTPSFGNVSTDSGYFDLEDALADYDEIEIKYTAFGNTGIVKAHPVDFSGSTLGSTTFHWSEIQPNIAISTDPERTVFRHMDFYASDISDSTHDRLNVDAVVWGWNGDPSSAGKLNSTFTKSWNSEAGQWTASGFTGGILAITGIKYTESGSTKDPELVDIRTGADGTVYETAGDAMRGQVTALEGQIGTAGTNLAAAYDATQTYAVGDYCVKDGVLYRCTTAISTAEAWTAGHWTAVKAMSEMTAGIGELDDQVQDLKEDLKDTQDDIFTYVTASIKATATGYKLKDDGYAVADADYKMVKYKVSAGETYKIVSDHKFQLQTVEVTHTSGDLTRVGATYGTGTFVLKVPDTATFLIVSTTINDSQASVNLADNVVADTKADLISVESLFGFGLTNFHVLAGRPHSSNNDKIDITVASGQQYDIVVVSSTDEAITGTVYEWRPSGTYQSNGDLVVGKTTKTAKGNTVKISLYVNAPSADCDIYVLVTNKDYIYKQIDDKVISLRGTDLYFTAGKELITGSLQTSSMTVSSDLGAIACMQKIPCVPAESVRIIVPEITGLTYKYRFGFYKADSTLSSQIASTTDNEVTIPSNCYYFSYGIYGYSGSTEITYNLLTSLPETKVTVRFLDRSERDYLATDTFEYLYKDYEITERNKDVLLAVNSASYYGHHGGNSRNINKQFSLLATTDVHGDVTRFTSAIDYLNNTDSVDAGICLGDIVASNFASYKEWYPVAVGLSEKPFYTVIGNHDGGNGKTGATSATVQEQFEAFIEPTLDKIGDGDITTPYYSIKNDTYKIYLIVLNVYDAPDDKDGNGDFIISRGQPTFSQAQISWLISELEDIPSDYTLLIALHHLPAGVTYTQCNWTTPNTAHGSTNEDGYALVGLIDAWINGTSYEYTITRESGSVLPDVVFDADFTSCGVGLFACYLTGHTHFDAVGYVTAYNDQKVVILSATANDLYQNVGSDLPRAVGTKAEDCITVVVVDTSTQTVRLVRVGSNITDAMTNRTYHVLSYGVNS